MNSNEYANQKTTITIDKIIFLQKVAPFSPHDNLFKLLSIKYQQLQFVNLKAIREM